MVTAARALAPTLRVIVNSVLRRHGMSELVPQPLNAQTLAYWTDQVEGPSYDRALVTPGVVHIGVGGFHRAHQAMYLDRLMNKGQALDWGICGVGVMPADRKMQEALDAQDGLYTPGLQHIHGTYDPPAAHSVDRTYPGDPVSLPPIPSASSPSVLIDGPR